METAQHTADLLGLDISPCPFMREIFWGPTGQESILEGGHPWFVSWAHVAEGLSLLDRDWPLKDPYCKSQIVASVDRVTQEFDAWLAALGYAREGEHYRVTGEDTDKTVAMFSHAGSSSAVLSHMFNIPFPQFVGMIPLEFTSVTTVTLSGKPGELICPRMVVGNDARHIEGISGENIISN